MNDIAIVLVGFNRAKSLKRLLRSVLNANFQNSSPPIYICLDFSPVQDLIVKYIEDLLISNPEIEVIRQTTRLGLKEHILLCGDLVQDHDGLIMLEDDLVVSPSFYQYAQEAFNYYKDSSLIASIALFKYEYDETRFFPFHPLEDDSDVHFLQVPCSWGQLWSSQQWTDFRNWLSVQGDAYFLECLPSYVNDWGENSWKKLFIAYMIHKGLYTVFPNRSLTTNLEEQGTNSNSTGLFNSVLSLEGSDWKYKSLEDSKSVYDSWFEITEGSLKKWNPNLSHLSFDVDIKRSKTLKDYKTQKVLTFSDYIESEYTFSKNLSPIEANIAMDIVGSSLKILPLKELQPLADDPKPCHNLRLNPTSSGVERCTIGILITVTRETLTSLPDTLQSIKEIGHLSIIPLVCCHERLYREVYQILLTTEKIIAIASSDTPDLTSLIEFGFQKLKVNSKIGFLSWIYSGNLLKFGALSKLHRFTTQFENIAIFQGIAMDDDSAYLNQNAASYRIRHHQWEQSDQAFKLINAEGFFFKKEIIPFISLGKNCLKPNLNKKRSAIIALQFFNNTSGSQVKTSNTDILNGKYFYLKNIPYLRAFYRLTHQLPNLYRYDPVHRNFYKMDY